KMPPSCQPSAIRFRIPVADGPLMCHRPLITTLRVMLKSERPCMASGNCNRGPTIELLKLLPAVEDELRSVLFDHVYETPSLVPLLCRVPPTLKPSYLFRPIHANALITPTLGFSLEPLFLGNGHCRRPSALTVGMTMLASLVRNGWCSPCCPTYPRCATRSPGSSRSTLTFHCPTHGRFGLDCT